MITRPPAPRSTIAPPMSLVHRNTLVRFRSISLEPCFDGQIDGRRRHQTPADIIDQDMNRAELFEGPAANRFALGRLSNVAADGEGLTIPGTDIGRCRSKARLIAPDQDHIGASLGDRQSHFPAEAATAAGNEQPLSVQTKSIEDGHGRLEGACDFMGQSNCGLILTLPEGIRHSLANVLRRRPTKNLRLELGNTQAGGVLLTKRRSDLP